MLEDGLKTGENHQIELFEALANYVYQLRDDAIQPTADTPSLFREAQSLLGEDRASPQGTSFENQTARLLERIDLEASGGFDAIEAGEVPELDRYSDSKSEPLRTQNTLHRLRASLETVARHIETSRSGTSLTALFERQRKLIDTLTPNPLVSQTMPLADLEELISVQQTAATADLSIDGEGYVHPSYIPILSTLVSRLAALLSSKMEHMKITRQEDAIEIRVALNINASHLSDLRATAIEHGLLHVDAPLPEGQELQYLLVAGSSQANELLVRSSELIDHLQLLCAGVAVDFSTELPHLTITLPAHATLAQVTVFKLSGALYAILTGSVAQIDYESRTDNVSKHMSVDRYHRPYKLSPLNRVNANHEACLLIDEEENRRALFVDQIEPSGQLAVLDASLTSTYIGGSVRLQDRRLVVLLWPEDLDDPLLSPPDFQQSTQLRLLVLGGVAPAMQLSQRSFQVSLVDGEMDAMTSLQEQRPHAILATQKELANYGNLTLEANRRNVPVIVRKSDDLAFEPESSHMEFKTITTSAELETLLHEIAAQDEKIVETAS